MEKREREREKTEKEVDKEEKEGLPVTHLLHDFDFDIPTYSVSMMHRFSSVMSKPPNKLSAEQCTPYISVMFAPTVWQRDSLHPSHDRGNVKGELQLRGPSCGTALMYTLRSWVVSAACKQARQAKTCSDQQTAGPHCNTTLMRNICESRTLCKCFTLRGLACK